jgi:hypothetical protein
VNDVPDAGEALPGHVAEAAGLLLGEALLLLLEPKSHPATARINVHAANPPKTLLPIEQPPEFACLGRLRLWVTPY